MPLPLLLLGLGAAAVGVGKSIKAGIDQHDANETNEVARLKIERVTKEVKTFQENSGKAVNSLGESKIYILENSINPFVESFEKLHNVELTESVGLNELKKFAIDKASFSELKELGSMAAGLTGGIASGAALGAITAFGAYGAAMTFGAASTGTAIATLSGAAATNATLAFLGGGATAVGGLGIAGGTAVLGGLVAGPALAVLGFVVGAKASANRDKAYENYSEAKKFEEEMKTVKSLCKGIRLRANMFERALIKLDSIFKPLVYKLEDIIETSGTDFAKYDNEEKMVVAASMSLAGAVKAVLDTPILNEDGSLTDGAEKVIESVKPALTAQI